MRRIAASLAFLSTGTSLNVRNSTCTCDTMAPGLRRSFCYLCRFGQLSRTLSNLPFGLEFYSAVLPWLEPFPRPTHFGRWVDITVDREIPRCCKREKSNSLLVRFFSLSASPVKYM